MMLAILRVNRAKRHRKDKPKQDVKVMKLDVAYLERSSGKWVAWSYSDGQRVKLTLRLAQYEQESAYAIALLERHGYRVVVI